MRVRSERDAKLAATDWRVTRAYEEGQPVQSAWLVYRQALRDVTAQPGFPTQVEWPEQPV